MYNNRTNELNKGVYLFGSPEGFRYNVNNETINKLYRRYKSWKGLRQNEPITNEQRREFENYLDGVLKK